MMPAKFVVAFFIVSLTISSVLAQKGINVHDHLLIKASDKYLYGAPKEEYEGTPYLNDEFESGFVYINGQKSKAMDLRFNIFADNIEFREGEVVYLIAAGQALTRVEIGKHVLVVEKDGFLEVLQEGRLTLLTKKIVNYRQKVVISNIPAKYSPPSDIFYYTLDKGKPVKVGSVRKLISNLPDKQNELTQFAEKENLSGRDEKELVKLVQYYNSL